MKSYAAYALWLLVLLNVVPGAVHAQQITADWRKSEFAILLAGYVEWPDEESIDTFRIGVLASEPVYTQMSLKSELQKFKDRPFRVNYFKRHKQIGDIDMLYVGRQKNSRLRKINNFLGDRPVLVVTDSAQSMEYSMYNLLGMNIAEGKAFELNKLNIEAAGLHVSSQILLIGGSAEDVRHVAMQFKDESEEIREEMDSLGKELENKRRELRLSEEKLRLRSVEVNELVAEIEFQTRQLTTLSDSVDLKEMDLIDKVRLLSAQEASIKEREMEIEALNRDIAEKEAGIKARSDTIAKQMDDIVLQTLMMKKQEEILDSQLIQIEKQKSVIYFFLILAVLLLGLGFMIFRAYQIKKRANRILEEKNRVIQKQKSDILNQKEEILAQRDELQVVNRKIEKQNENITDSIYYALTIQQAMLPEVDEMKKYYEGFMVYMPKDIVSGDFYWFAQQWKKRTGERAFYFAVVDCTGHGVPGGFLSMIGARALDSIVNDYQSKQTDEILELMDSRIRSALNQQKTDNEDGMDVCLCKIIPPAKESDKIYVSFSGAKRALFLQRRGREVEVIRGDRRTIGGKFFNPTPFTKSELSLNPGARLYLTSDGLMDQHSPEREKYGSKRFIEFLRSTYDLSMQAQQNRLEEDIMGFMKLEKQRDDITIMGIKL